jgi:hypothetical protein
MEGRSEAQGRHRACKYVYQPKRRVIGHQMSSAFGAVLPLACCRLLEHADMFGASRDVHGLRSPQRKSVDWSTGPRATGLAMAVAHAFGFARDLNLNCPTETSTFVHHQSPRFSVPLSCLLAHREAQAEPRRLLQECVLRSQQFALMHLSPSLARPTSGQYSQGPGTQRKTSPATATWQTDGNDR